MFPAIKLLLRLIISIDGCKLQYSEVLVEKFYVNCVLKDWRIQILQLFDLITCIKYKFTVNILFFELKKKKIIVIIVNFYSTFLIFFFCIIY